MNKHKIVEIRHDPLDSKNDIQKLFDDLDKEGYEFLTWVSPWKEHHSNYRKFDARYAIFKRKSDA